MSELFVILPSILPSIICNEFRYVKSDTYWLLERVFILVNEDYGGMKIHRPIVEGILKLFKYLIVTKV